MIHIAKALRAKEQERLAAVSASAAGPLPSALVEEMESSSSDDEGSRKRARPENPENRVPIPIAGMHRARRGTVVNNAGESCFLSRPSRVLHYHSPVLSQPDVQQLSRKGVQCSSCGNRGSTSSWMASKTWRYGGSRPRSRQAQQVRLASSGPTLHFPISLLLPLDCLQCTFRKLALSRSREAPF